MRDAYTVPARRQRMPPSPQPSVFMGFQRDASVCAKTGIVFYEMKYIINRSKPAQAMPPQSEILNQKS